MAMSFMVVKHLCRYGSKRTRLATNCLYRMSSTSDPCKDCGNQPPAKEPKAECCPPPPPPSGCREPQPCPPLPQCPPAVCPSVPDPTNPCNYCPPECADPDYPDLTKLKKLQCKFQEPNGIPVFLKGGKFDVFLYQLTVVLVLFGCASGFYNIVVEVFKS